MKSLLLLIILCGGAMLSSGCSTVAYSGRERWQMIGRNISYEGAQAMDDIDSALLLRPAGRMTLWNVR